MANRRTNDRVQFDHKRVVCIMSRDGKAMYELVTAPKRSLWVEGAHHNDFNEVGRSQYLEALRQFAASLKPSSAGGQQAQ